MSEGSRDGGLEDLTFVRFYELILILTARVKLPSTSPVVYTSWRPCATQISRGVQKKQRFDLRTKETGRIRARLGELQQAPSHAVVRPPTAMVRTGSTEKTLSPIQVSMRFCTWISDAVSVTSSLSNCCDIAVFVGNTDVALAHRTCLPFTALSSWRNTRLLNLNTTMRRFPANTFVIHHPRSLHVRPLSVL